MSSKEIAIEVIRKLPDEASLAEIAHELEFVAGIHDGTAELDRGESLTAEELLKRIPEWARTSRRSFLASGSRDSSNRFG